MLRRILSISFIVTILLISLPTIVFAEDSDSNVVITVDGENPNVEINGNSSTSVDINGVGTQNVIVGGDGVVGQTLYIGMAIANNDYEKELRQQINAYQDFIVKTVKELNLTEQAVANLIQKGQYTDADIRALGNLLNQMSQQVSVLDSSLYQMILRIKQGESETAKQFAQYESAITLVQSQITLLQNQNRLLGEQIKTLNERLFQIEQAEYTRTHSGIIYKVQQFFANVGYNVKSLLGLI